MHLLKNPINIPLSNYSVHWFFSTFPFHQASDSDLGPGVIWKLYASCFLMLRLLVSLFLPSAGDSSRLFSYLVLPFIQLTTNSKGWFNAAVRIGVALLWLNPRAEAFNGQTVCRVSGSPSFPVIVIKSSFHMGLCKWTIPPLLSDNIHNEVLPIFSYS